MVRLRSVWHRRDLRPHAGGSMTTTHHSSTEITLPQAKEIIGGHIEVVKLRGLAVPAVLLVNEDGISMQLELNPVASYIATEGRLSTTVIYGNAILITGAALKGWA